MPKLFGRAFLMGVLAAGAGLWLFGQMSASLPKLPGARG